MECRGPQTSVLGQPVARRRLNDGAKLWISFKLCFKTNVQHEKKQTFYQKWSWHIYCKLLLVQQKKTKFLPKTELVQNFLHTFVCVAEEKYLHQIWSCHKIYCKLLLVQHQKNLSSNGVVTKFIANFCLCKIRKTKFLPKMELSQNLLQM